MRSVVLITEALSLPRLSRVFSLQHSNYLHTFAFVYSDERVYALFKALVCKVRVLPTPGREEETGPVIEWLDAQQWYVPIVNMQELLKERFPILVRFIKEVLGDEEDEGRSPNEKSSVIVSSDEAMKFKDLIEKMWSYYRYLYENDTFAAFSMLESTCVWASILKIDDRSAKSERSLMLYFSDKFGTFSDDFIRTRGSYQEV